jgi:hypothetical protein
MSGFRHMPPRLVRGQQPSEIACEAVDRQALPPATFRPPLFPASAFLPAARSPEILSEEERDLGLLSMLPADAESGSRATG